MNRLARFLLIGFGTLCVALGIVGIFVPILPTTPFLLLAAFCFARSSRRFLNWLLTNRWFGAYIRNYREGRGIPRREKVLTIIALWLTIGFSSLYAVSVWWGKLLLIVVAIGVTVHLVRLRTFKPDAEIHLVNGLRSPEQQRMDGE
jgi:uncharacterized membrane protein YbaN (DUF454 family)